MRWLTVLFFLLIASASSAQALFEKNSSSSIAAPAQVTQAKIDDLMRLLQDADVRRWIQSQSQPAIPISASMASLSALP
ncbi:MULTISPECIES: hypothetical protein [Rhizobium]|uniref:hypothetical protein n=1 Tax=Rhizobium TaxID=379 RepID=UPI001A917858|nr:MULTISPECIES: hypothetical protein [Rhizobium]MBX4998860.1 hypothetical protein [Rhizobium lentis]MBX5017769.1 hypothetical protein [Rhizobium lentis]MBX5069095.1 hypothetical protein [Rhizobium lentis]MBX5080128.1 hypothetical protein [Rhizobium lentis]MBX5135392.1 hypothetical protein [Rhizobium lentis]